MTETATTLRSSSSHSDSFSWWPVIRELRQDQEVISERWQTTRRQYNQLNVSCDQLLESLWIEHALSFSLNKVLSHRSPPADWMATSREADSIVFLNASQRISSPNLLESYSRFLGNLRSHPEAVAEVLKWAGQEGLDSAHLTYDLVSVVYGHCLFPEDHTQLLYMICHLLMDHIKQCSSIKEMFSIEPVCSRVISEYCQQLPGLKAFLSQVLRKPLTTIMDYTEGYLDYDVTKASARLQGTESFDVGAYIESSSRFIANVCGELLMELNMYQDFFPPTLKWLLSRLKGFMKEKWPELSNGELRRPVSYMLFGFIISSAFVNPDLLGIMDVRIVLDDIAWYNISQVIGVLQGCAWIIDKVETSDYPMRRVVRYMDMIPFNSLIDSIDGGLDGDTPPVVSVLPGLTKSSYLFSQNQMENIVGTVYDACNSFMLLSDVTEPQLEASKAISVIPDAIIRKDRRNPYSFSLNNLHTCGSNLTVLPPLSPSKGDSTSGKSPRMKHKQRSRSVWSAGTRVSGVGVAGGGDRSSIDAKSQTLGYSSRSGALPQSHSNPLDITRVSPTAGGGGESSLSMLPQEVLIAAVWDPERSPSHMSWNIQLMSEEEFIHERFSPGMAAVDPALSLMATAMPTRHKTMTNSMEDVEEEVKKKSPISVTLTREEEEEEEEVKKDEEKEEEEGKEEEGEKQEENSCSLPSTTSEVDEISTPNNKKEAEPNVDDMKFMDESTCEDREEGNEDNGQRSREKTRNEGERVSIRSWSPETYDGSITGEEEEDGTGGRLNGGSTPKSDFTKSCEPFMDIEMTKNKPSISVSAPTSASTTPKSKKSLKSWLGKKISRSKKKGREEVGLELESPPRKRQDSYTQRTKHITEKYERISQEKRASKLPPPPSDPPDQLSQQVWYNRLPKTIEDFVPSILFQQLKYKLTILLQQIHLPQFEMRETKEGREREGCKEELMDILKVVRHSVQWRDDYSETGVLDEVIGQLECLDNTCVLVLLEGVKENHEVHLEYLKYLSSLQAQCYDACLQVNAVQTVINRARQLQMDSFLNFSMSMFCDERSAKLEQVKRDLENCGTADEKCALVQDLREAFKISLERDVNWTMFSDGTELDLVHRMCDDHIFTHLYKYIFHPNGDSDKQRDDVFHKHIETISETLTPQHHLLKIPSVYFSSCPWKPVQSLLLDMSLYKSPHAKLHCITKACKLLIRLLQLARCGDPPGADDTFPVLVYILIKANPTSLLSTEQYIKVFCEDLLSGETAYWWTQFCSAIGFLRTPEFTQ